MKAIKTTYHSPTRHRPAKITARDDDGNKFTQSWDYGWDSDLNHRVAAMKLCEKMDWRFDHIGGGYKNNVYWVSR